MTRAAGDDEGWSRRQALAGIGAAALAGTVVPWAASAGGARRRSGAPRAPGDPAADLVVHPDRVRGRVPERMLGLSVERQTMTLPWLDPANTALVALLQRFGPGVLRIGGNSVERIGWAPAGPGRQPTVVAPGDIDRLAAFAEAIDAHVIYGTPFASGTDASVADEAVVAAAALGPRLLAMELANEPDLYALDVDLIDVTGWTRWFAAWQRRVGVVRASVPGMAFAGPGTCLLQAIDAWVAPFSTATGGVATTLTQHYYRGFGLTPQDLPLLLAPDPLLATSLDRLRDLASASGTTYRLGETNSFANGGEPGVSNSLGAAVWAIGLYLDAAAHGAAGVNFHNSGNGAGYPAIAQLNGVVTDVRPLYHALLLAASAGTGALLEVSVASSAGAVRAWAIRRSDVSLSVVVLNVGDDPVDLVVDCGGTVASCTVERLVGSSLAATSGVTFRGAGAAIDGSWTPEAPEVAPVAGSAVTVAAITPGAVLAHVVLVAPTVPSTTSSSTTTSSVPTATSAPRTDAAEAAEAVPGSPTYVG